MGAEAEGFTGRDRSTVDSSSSFIRGSVVVGVEVIGGDSGGYGLCSVVEVEVVVGDE